MNVEKYSDRVIVLLKNLGYEYCFFVPGGNIMHLLNSARAQMRCVPFVHEVAAAIAAEYFNEIRSTHESDDRSRSFSLVTAGPGLTNALTGIAGAYLESRELLVLGGQVKSSDLARGQIRQRGIQEVDGVEMARAVCKSAERIESPLSDDHLRDLVMSGVSGRRGPVFLEFCLDAQAQPVPISADEISGAADPDSSVSPDRPSSAAFAVSVILSELSTANRPVILLGGGVSPVEAWRALDGLRELGAPLMTTWNGFDRVPDNHELFVGRPNTWGQRSANILLSQSDLIVVLGSRLGLQQTGFNWRNWTSGRVIQVDIDPAELEKGHPEIAIPLCADANAVLRGLVARNHRIQMDPGWLRFCREVRMLVPAIDPMNTNSDEFLSPFQLVDQLSERMGENEILIPASSGSGQFIPMQVFRSKPGQRVVTNKGLASMGYGLAGAIGAALAAPDVRTVLVEGDGSFSQSIQELGTVAVNNLNLKMFLLDNDGYASIRTTQKNYFGGEYLGCDRATGLGLPIWSSLAAAFGIPHVEVGPEGLLAPEVLSLFESPGPALFVVRVDPDQTYFPKISSRMEPDGSMVSSPLHLMTPPLTDEIAQVAFRFAGEGRAT